MSRTRRLGDGMTVLGLASARPASTRRGHPCPATWRRCSRKQSTCRTSAPCLMMLWTGPMGFAHAAQIGSGGGSGTRRASGLRVEARQVTCASWPSVWNTTVCRASTGRPQSAHLASSLTERRLRRASRRAQQGTRQGAAPRFKPPSAQKVAEPGAEVHLGRTACPCRRSARPQAERVVDRGRCTR
jgi:hypothetical protein